MKKVAVFASGGGTNFEALVNQEYKNIEIALLVCNVKDAYCIKRAINHNIPYVLVESKLYKDRDEHEAEILKHLKEHNIDFIVLAGYMRILSNVLLENYEGRMINIHPALLPAFKGAHGIEDSYNYGVKIMGVTVHYVSHDLDAGRIIDQACFRVEDGMTLEEAEANIHKLEYEIYPRVLKKLLED